MLVAPQDKNGNYAITFGATKSQGLYKVSAQAGAKSGPALAEFTVHTYVELDIDDAVADNKSFLEDMDKLVTAVKKEGATVCRILPPRRRWRPSSTRSTRPRSRSPIRRRTSRPRCGAVQDHGHSKQPDAEETLQPMFDHLSQLDDQMKKSKVELEREIEESQKGSQTCDAIDHATQALKAIPDMIRHREKTVAVCSSVRHEHGEV